MKRDKQDEDSKKRVYSAPKIVESGAFEHLVLACAQQPGSTRSGGCGFDPALVNS